MKSESIESTEDVGRAARPRHLWLRPAARARRVPGPHIFGVLQPVTPPAQAGWTRKSQPRGSHKKGAPPSRPPPDGPTHPHGPGHASGPGICWGLASAHVLGPRRLRGHDAARPAGCSLGTARVPGAGRHRRRQSATSQCPWLALVAADKSPVAWDPGRPKILSSTAVAVARSVTSRQLLPMGGGVRCCAATCSCGGTGGPAAKGCAREGVGDSCPGGGRHRGRNRAQIRKQLQIFNSCSCLYIFLCLAAGSEGGLRTACPEASESRVCTGLGVQIAARRVAAAVRRSPRRGEQPRGYAARALVDGLRGGKSESQR